MLIITHTVDDKFLISTEQKPFYFDLPKDAYIENKSLSD